MSMVAVITSPDNEKVRYLRSLHEHSARQRARHFLVEGVRLVEEALNAGLAPSLVLVDEDALDRTPRGRALHERLKHVGYLPASPRVLKTAAETVTPQGVVAAVPLPSPPPASEEAAGTLLVIDGVQDPGNLGTILRAAEATATQPVLLAPGTVDVFAPKVVRAGMGAHFRLPLVSGTWEDLEPYLRGRDVWLAEPRGGRPYYRVDWSRPSAIVVGSEATGPSAEAEARATGRLTIPMVGPTESLNAAVAASVIMFETLRQRLAQREVDNQ
ncbi:MAG: TrmH family RNA methyltransferase [Chloroflexota bacterium]